MQEIQTLEAPAGRTPVDVETYYEEATADYAAWSPERHMHFGFWRAGLNPLRREPMLEEMTRQVVDRLGLHRGRVADLGCGVGASCRWIARARPELEPVGVALVPAQIREARARSPGLAFVQADFRRTGLEGGAFDGAYAIESACHAPEPAPLLAEAARLLRPGGRLVVADGFLLRPPGRGLFSAVLRAVMGRWAVARLSTLRDFAEALRSAGFRDIRIEDLSLRIAPSVLHAPLLTVRYALERWLAGERLSPARRGHLWACLLCPLVGLFRRRFGYFVVSATKGR